MQLDHLKKNTYLAIIINSPISIDKLIIKCPIYTLEENKPGKLENALYFSEKEKNFKYMWLLC